jgi:protein tyrosine phosphatase
MPLLQDGSDKAHEVRHFQHIDWRDGYIPKTEKSVLDLVEKLQKSQQQAGNTTMVVQCR